MDLRSLDPDAILSVLDLTGPGLSAAEAAALKGDRLGALSALRDVYRSRHPRPSTPPPADAATIARADRVCNHTFERAPYEPADYGKVVDWMWDPRGDIEWVATVYRFYWAGPLAQAFAATANEKYPAAFVELATDWIAKHPLEKRGISHPVYTHWKGFPWLDIQTGRRATSICNAFPSLIHGAAFTPEFLGILLASLYDHQVKTEHEPMNKVHNKAIFEQRGFVNICATIPEFKDAKRWMQLAVDRSLESFLAQTTTDGVQREWSYGYHSGVLNDAIDIRDRARTFGLSLPKAYEDRIRLMYDYIFAVATPDLGAPMFGDGSRDLVDVGTQPRSAWPLHDTLVTASEVTGDPRYRARATLDLAKLPKKLCYAFPEAGMYAFRSGWGPDAVHLGLHCSPLAISSHDQPDNGTFELFAFGRWLMPDSGFYVYGHDPDARKWHRQTRVHNTLTVDETDIADAGRHLLWKEDDELTTLVVENASYGSQTATQNPKPGTGAGGREGEPSLVHRRTVWFVGRRYFVVLDEALGSLPGALDIHFWFAPGEVVLDAAAGTVHTSFSDANVLVASLDTPAQLSLQDGWTAWKYGYRKERKGLRVRHTGQAPNRFLTVLAPYRGASAPKVGGGVEAGCVPGAGKVVVNISVDGQAARLSRSL
jgi:heparan-sulfate lyase